jgi:hypothetical protein
LSNAYLLYCRAVVLNAPHNLKGAQLK